MRGNIYSSLIDYEMQIIEKNISKENYIFEYQLLEYKNYFHLFFIYMQYIRIYVFVIWDRINNVQSSASVTILILLLYFISGNVSQVSFDLA